MWTSEYGNVTQRRRLAPANLVISWKSVWLTTQLPPQPCPAFPWPARNGLPLRHPRALQSLPPSLSPSLSDLFNLYLKLLFTQNEWVMCATNLRLPITLFALADWTWRRRIGAAPFQLKIRELNTHTSLPSPPAPPLWGTVLPFCGGLAYICRRLSKSFELGHVITCVIRARGWGGEGVLCIWPCPNLCLWWHGTSCHEISL